MGGPLTYPIIAKHMRIPTPPKPQVPDGHDFTTDYHSEELTIHENIFFFKNRALTTFYFCAKFTHSPKCNAEVYDMAHGNYSMGLNISAARYLLDLGYSKNVLLDTLPTEIHPYLEEGSDLDIEDDIDTSTGPYTCGSSPEHEPCDVPPPPPN